MLYQFNNIEKKVFNSGYKAPQDIIKIADSMGFNVLSLHTPIRIIKGVNIVLNQTMYFFEWLSIYVSIEKNSIILLQSPNPVQQYTRWYTLERLKKNKNCKFITLFHDVNQMRNEGNIQYMSNEYQKSVDISDGLIVHNDSMKKWFVSQGVDSSKLISLEIFDYLTDVSSENIKYSKNIIIAGNLDSNKAGYLAYISKLRNLHFDLYGNGWTSGDTDTISYHGAFLAEDLPRHLNRGFGLIWDGDSIDTCSGPKGEYLRYNNPHKLSLYLTCGIPVIIWTHAAEAEFVKKYNVGICVNSLYDIEDKLKDINENEYIELCKNVKNQSEKLREGYYSKKAIIQAINKIEKKLY